MSREDDGQVDCGADAERARAGELHRAGESGRGGVSSVQCARGGCLCDMSSSTERSPCYRGHHVRSTMWCETSGVRCDIRDDARVPVHAAPSHAARARARVYSVAVCSSRSSDHWRMSAATVSSRLATTALIAEQ